MHTMLSIAAAMLVAVTLAAPAQGQSVRATGMFSNMTYYKEGGDVVGTEIFIFYAGSSGHMALVQCSPAVPGAPVLAKAVVRGTRVQFTLPPTENSFCPAATFTGVATRTELRGSFGPGEETYVLRRKASYWQ